MLLGPYIIRKCRACRGSMGQMTLLSGNTFSAKFWTDSKREAPMLPELPVFVKCPHCGVVAPIEHLKKLGEKESDEFDNSGLPLVGSLGFNDFIKLLRQPRLGLQQKLYLRVHALWAGNDTRRGKTKIPPLSPAEQRNIDALRKLLDLDRMGNRILAAELCRETGRFDECIELLKGVSDERKAAAVTQIQRLAKAKIWAVRRLVYKD